MDYEGSEDSAIFSLLSHHDDLRSKLWKLQQDAMWCDLVLIGADGSVGVHQVVVATFSDMLTGSADLPGECRILSDHPVECLQALVCLIYTGQTQLTFRTAKQLTAVLTQLRLHATATECSKLFPLNPVCCTNGEPVAVKVESESGLSLQAGGLSRVNSSVSAKAAVVRSQVQCNPSSHKAPLIPEPVVSRDGVNQELELTRAERVRSDDSGKDVSQLASEELTIDGKKNKLAKILNKMIVNKSPVKQEPGRHTADDRFTHGSESLSLVMDAAERMDENQEDASNDDEEEDDGEVMDDEETGQMISATGPQPHAAESDTDSDATVVEGPVSSPKEEPVLLGNDMATESDGVTPEEGKQQAGRLRQRSVAVKSEKPSAGSNSLNGFTCICSVGIPTKRLTIRSIRRHSRKCQGLLRQQKAATPSMLQRKTSKAKSKEQKLVKNVKVKKDPAEPPRRPGRPRKIQGQCIDGNQEILSMGFTEITMHFSKSLSDPEDNNLSDSSSVSRDCNEHFSDDLHAGENAVTYSQQSMDTLDSHDNLNSCSQIPSTQVGRTAQQVPKGSLPLRNSDSFDGDHVSIGSTAHGTTVSGAGCLKMLRSMDVSTKGKKEADNGLFYLNNKCKIWLPKAQPPGDGNIFCACGGYYPPSLLPKHHAYCKIINYQCYRCLAFFVKESKLRDHIGSCHFVTSKKYYQCSTCGKMFIDYDFMVIHYHMHRYVATVSKKLRELLKCRKCDVTFRAEKSLIDHLYAEHDVSDTSEDNMVNKIYRCMVPSVPACDFKTLLPYRMESHVFMVHSNEYPIECATCSKRFKVKQQCDNHQRFNHDHFGQLYHCPTCDKGFKSRSTLKGHRLIHAERKNILCDECPFQTKSPSILKSHKDSFHQDSIQFKTVTQDVKHYKCEYCDYSSIFRHKVATHVARHKANTEGIKHYQCEICGKRFPAKSNLRSHMVWHGDKVHKCPHEGCTFTSNHIRTVRNHITCRHMDFKPFSCAICGYSAKLRGNLILHLRNTHKLYVKTKGKLSKQDDQQVQDPRKEAIIVDNVARLKCDVDPQSLPRSVEQVSSVDAKVGGVLPPKPDLGVPPPHPHIEMEPNVVHYLHGEGFSWADAVTWSANLS